LKPERKPVDKREITFPNENEIANLVGSPLIAIMKDPVDNNYIIVPISYKVTEYKFEFII